MTRKSSTETLIAAMRILARDIQSGDCVANAAIAEAADRLEELEAQAAIGRRAVDANRHPYGGRLTGDSVAQDPSTAPEHSSTVVVNAGALKHLKSCIKALDSLTAADDGLSFAISESAVISAARRLLEGASDGH